ncbi:MAG: metal-dependent hydrolase [Geobacteraceae bacterium]|nr:metal-dependent hydrolase [Geobacteraceae bacterium]
MKKVGFLASLVAMAIMLFAAPLFASEKTQVTWYGQSAFKVVTPGGKVLVVDPWIKNPANKNGEKDLEGMTKVDLILLTHGHGDHIGDSVQIAKQSGAKLVAMFDLQKAMVAYKGFPNEQADRSTTGNFGGELTLLDGEVKVKFVHAVHGDSLDTDNGPVYGGRAGGFLISVKGGPSIYHTGDTDLFGDMALLNGKVDMMLVCIGDKFTMGPVGAAAAVKLIMPKMAVPMHFGTYSVLTGTAEDFRTELKKLQIEKLLRQMKVGETITW